MTAREHAILETLTYHDLFDFPLTAHEVHLTTKPIHGVSQRDTLLALDDLKDNGLVGSLDGFWHLAGREEVVAKRKERYDIAERKFRIAKRFFRIARHMPFLRAAYVCNTLARSNARAGSDIDLFIVAAHGRVWLARLFVTGFAKLLRARPNITTAKDRLCLSFFNSEGALDLRPYAIENDVYLPRWLFDLYPLYDESGISGKIFAENAWARDRISGLRKPIGSVRRTFSGNRAFMKARLERLLDRTSLERRAKAFQLRIMPENLKTNAREGRGVVLTDTTLKLHGLDRRAEIRDRFERAISTRASKVREYAGTI